MKKDYSKEILEKYYNPQGKVLQITLKDKTILEGVLAGFFHGDPENEKEPFIIKWNFIPENKMSKYYLGIATDIKDECSMIINQNDIENVRFK